MKQKSILRVLCVLMALALCSCGSPAPTASSAATSSAKASSAISSKSGSSEALSSDEASSASATSADASSAISSAKASSAISSAKASSAKASSAKASSAKTSSAKASSVAVSSKAVSSAATSSTPAAAKIDIEQAMKSAGKTLNSDVSSLFSDDSRGYLINGGPYKVDAAVLERLTSGNVKVEGTGSVIWKSHSTLSKSINSDPFDGIIPVSKLNDPIYCSMQLPSEYTTYMTYRVNGTNMYPAAEKHKRIKTIGAIYKNHNITLPDDAKITVCIGKIVLLANTEDKGWFVGNQLNVPAVSNANRLYYLPWTLEHTLGSVKLANNLVSTKSDHIEISLTGADLNATAFKGQGAEEMVLHFWGNDYSWTTSGTNVKGVVVAIEAWIKEPEMVGKVGLALGADWRDGSGSVDQALSGRNYLLTTEKRLCIGHNVGPKAYDSIMDVTKVKSLLGMK